MRRNFDFGKVHKTSFDGDTRITFDLDLKRFERQFGKAQYQLDSMIMTDMVPYMPMITQTFINMTKAKSNAIAGTGYVYAAAPPYGRFLYKGKVMVSPSTGSTYAQYSEKKVLVSEYRGKTNAREDIVFTDTFHPKVTKEWFEAAKKVEGKKWIRLAKKVAGGG